MIKFLTRYNFHFLLIPIFFIWHCCNSYFGLITWSYVFKYGAYYIGLSLALFGVGKLLLKTNTRAAIWASVLLTIFFFFGAFHDFVRTSTFFSIISSYSILLPIILVIIVVSAIVLRRNKNKQIRMTAYLNAVLLFLLLLELQITVYQLLTHKSEKNNLTYGSAVPALNIAAIPDSLKPDIYFIIFDEFANTQSIKKYTGFDNAALDSLLLKKGFFVANHATSNYNATPHSLASTLNLQYLNADLEGYFYTPSISLKAQKTIDESFFPAALSAAGYNIINHSIFNFAGTKNLREPFFNFDIENILTLETLWGRINKDIWWNVSTRLYTSAEIGEKITQTALPRRKQTVANITNTLAELKKQPTRPVFVYTHLILPHNPFIYTKEGNVRNLSMYDHIAGKTKDSLYFQQVLYANTLIDSMTSLITQTSSGRPKVMIIAGDHGYRDPEMRDKIRDKEFANLNAIYFSDKNYSMLNDSMSSVNIFRIISNKYFHAKLPLLKDSTVMLQ